jgi:hypothetical protein
MRLSPTSICFVALATFGTNAQAISLAPPKVYLTSDPALVGLIKGHKIFDAFLGKCDQGSLTRGVDGGVSTFTYSTTCAVISVFRNSCSAYNVSVGGTIDNHRVLFRTFALQCTES